MNVNFESRSLLLEQLESRCMLAAGFFSQSADASDDFHPFGTDSDQDGPGGTRGAEIRILAEAQNQDRIGNETLLRGQNRRLQSTPHSGSSRQNVLRAQEGVLSTSVIGSVPVSAANSTNLNSPQLGLPLAIRRAVVQDGVQGIANDANVSEGGIVSAPLVRGAVLVDAIVAPEASDYVLATAGRFVDETPGLDSLNSTKGASNVGTSVDIDVDRFIDPSGSGLTIESRSNSDGFWDGLIEPQLGLQSESWREDSANGESEWEIRGETLQQLRDLAADPSADQSDDSNRLTDQVIATWFEGQGGLVDIAVADSRRVGGRDLPVHSSDLVGMVLDATVGMHRPVSLISGSLISGGLSTPEHPGVDGEAIRDAVLAAIDGEASSPVSPIDVQAPPKLSSIAYPGAVALAGALVILGRRKSVQLFRRTQSRTAPVPK